MDLVDLGTHTVAAELVGSGEPAVVFVAALGEPGANWAATREQSQVVTRQLAYDRAGIGQSPPRDDWSTPQSYGGFAVELARLLDVLAINQPVVLVGHSFGSLIVRAYTARWPDRVAGLVHVDGSVPELRWPTGGPASEADGDAPQATRINVDAGVRELQQVPPTAPGVPAIVLTRMPDWPYRDSTPERDAYWQRMQKELAAKLRAVQVVAVDAGHRIPEENPTLVAYCVDAVVEAVRAGDGVQLHEAALADRRGRLGACR